MHPIMFKPLGIWSSFLGLLLAACASPPPPVPDEETVTATPPVAAATPPVQAAAPPEAGRQAETVGETAGRALLFPGTGRFVNPAPGKSPQPTEGEGYTLNYEGADIREVVWNILEVMLKENYTIHPAVQGVVTLRTSRPIPRSALLPTLETLLRQYGFALVREGGLIKVMPAAFAIRGSVSAQLGSINTPLPQGFSLQIVPLKWVPAKEMWKLIEPFVSDPTVMRIDEARNFLILAGTEQELRHLVEAIDLLDADYLSGMSVGLFTLRSAEAQAVAQELSLIFGDGQKGPLAGVVRFIPVERLNGLLVVSSQPKYLEQAKSWIERLDRAGTGVGGRRLYVYPLQNGKAETLANLLNEIFGRGASRGVVAGPTVVGAPATVQSSPQAAGRSPQPAAKPGPATAASLSRDGGGSGQEIRVIADKENNAILIYATPADYELIEAAIKRLDVTQRQVLVEVLFAEVTLTNELQYGIEWYLNSQAGRTVTGRLGGATTPGTTVTPPAPANVPTSGGLTLLKSNAAGQVSAILNLLENDSRAKVVAAPSTMVADNHPATIKVGSRVPVKTQSQTDSAGNTIVESIQYVETGVLLDVTPRITSGSQVTLEINVEVSQARVNESSTIESPEISNRSAKSMVTIASGESVVMAGLIRQDSSNGSSGLPGLAKIPLLGGLFGKQTSNDTRTELVVIITPRVINDSRQARDFSEELKRKLPALREVVESVTAGTSKKGNGKAKKN